MLKGKKIGFIGAGKMGEALMKGLLASGAIKRSSIYCYDVDKKRCAYIREKHKLNVAKDNVSLAKKSDIIVLAVKPKDMGEVLVEISPFINSHKLIISIAAGITTKKIENILKKHVPVVRAMPNTPAIVRQAITAIARGRFVKEKYIKAAELIFSKVGKVFETQEDKMDLITAISGSGPAYIMYFIEALLVVAMEFGLSWEQALQIVLQTVYGSAKLLEESKIPPEQIREMVTSKGGVTEAALEVFRKHKVDMVIRKAVKTAVNRAKVLASAY